MFISPGVMGFLMLKKNLMKVDFSKWLFEGRMINACFFIQIQRNIAFTKNVNDFPYRRDHGHTIGALTAATVGYDKGAIDLLADKFTRICFV